MSLLKQAVADEDLKGTRSALHYLKIRDGREVDFCHVENDQPKFLVEAKRTETNRAPHLLHFCGK
ncbi:MAG: hypothetical protein KA419_15945 [Acidobacteria bacterium]|nr:hypothetical protein [Acidobacteriota bacterium]